MERAQELSAPYTNKPGVIGIYLVGSASRPFRDRLSDYDIEGLRVAAVLTGPTQAGCKELRDAVHAFLDGLGLTFHHDRMALIRWAFLTPEGKQAFRAWGTR